MSLQILYFRSQDPENSSDTETRRFIYFARLDYLSTWLKSKKFAADKATSIQGKLRTIQNLGRPKIVFPGCGMWMHVSKSLSFSIAPKSRIFASRIKTLTDNRLTLLKNCSNQCQFRLLFCLQRSVINRPRRRWGQPPRHGIPSPQPGCRPLARFPRLGSTRAPRWGSCCRSRRTPYGYNMTSLQASAR